MTQFSDGVRIGQSGTTEDTTKRLIPGYNYSQYGGFPITGTNRTLIGAPVALSATAVSASQAIAAAGNALINGGLAAGGMATFDVARCPTVVSSSSGDTTQTVTFSGTDQYGISLTATVTLNGTTTVTALKAFKTITQVAVSAALAGNLSAGSSDTFGLPFYAVSRDHYLTAWNSAFVTTGTFTVGDVTPATALTGDVRGTYLVPDASNGTKRLTVIYFAGSVDTVTALYGVAEA